MGKNIIVDNFPDALLALKLDEASSTLMYIGEAKPGSLETDAVWRIKRIDTSSGMIVTWADGDALFNNRWDQRAALTYI